MHGDLIAPQYGIRSPLPPRTDNPASADRTGPPPAAIRERLRALREECAQSWQRTKHNAPRGVFA